MVEQREIGAAEAGEAVVPEGPEPGEVVLQARRDGVQLDAQPVQPGGGVEEVPAGASIRILSGANEGRELQLMKALTTMPASPSASTARDAMKPTKITIRMPPYIRLRRSISR